MNPEQHKATRTSLLEELTGRVERTHRHLHERDERVSGNFPDQSQEMENQEQKWPPSVGQPHSDCKVYS